MGRYRENTTLFTKLAYSLGRTPRPAATPPSESLGSPAPQASFSTSSRISCLARILRFHPILAVFKLSDELILYIFSHIDISPDLRHPAISRHIWFRILCSMGIYDHHLQWLQFLRPLSVTCRAMRVRLLPRILERIEVSSLHNWGSSAEIFAKRFDTITNVLRVDTYLAATVKYFRALVYPGVGVDSCLKIHDGAFRAGWVYFSSIRQMPRVPPKSSHAGDRMDGRLDYNPAHESA